MSAFYERFERHAGGERLDGRSTHYCPGCGHGLVHKYLAAAIQELGIQDRTVAISPVGCAVFLYYYLDAGNTQAAHGRAPAVAIAHKLAHPESIVVSYQGDGDLASIGIAEVLHAAQLGVPITVLFVNNAVYGMTGGQMAPTTLAGQRTPTTPFGRSRTMGEPLRVAELLAGLDGPVYVERVALYDNRQRVRAQKAIRKGLQIQVENRGFALIEVLAECPLHLDKSPHDAERWVRDVMTKTFPLGVKKDVTGSREPWPDTTRPVFGGEALAAAVGASNQPAARFCGGFPTLTGRGEIAMKLAGAGGDGAQTAALVLVRAAINEGFDATHIPSYGPESRGGTSYADVRLAETEVLSPAAPAPDVLVAFNAPSLARFGPTVVDGGIVLYDSATIPERPDLPGRRIVPVPLARIANGLGRLTVKNVVALGGLAGVTHLFPDATFSAALRDAFRGKPALLPLNEAAFAAGVQAVVNDSGPRAGKGLP
jgi:2-oxoisovalerate ferredoxin oxidoreductase beta subunit